MTLQALTLRYAAFSIIATIINLLAQRIVLQLGETGPYFILAVAAGTIAGLIVKYILDKRWIFYDEETGYKSHGKKLSLYTMMGVFTTAIFWGFEAIFWLVWKSDLMRELGAIIGLSIGYVVKYNLDRRFVFTDQRIRCTS